jgi:hypothetical protein
MERSSGAMGERYRVSTDVGATATLRFTGRRLAWVSERGPRNGRARVIIDGDVVGTVDLYARSRRSREAVFTWSFARDGSHVVRLKVLGSPGRQRVVVDDLYVLT